MYVDQIILVYFRHRFGYVYSVPFCEVLVYFRHGIHFLYLNAQFWRMAASEF